MPIIDCYVQMLSQPYANGLPRVEVFVSTGYTKSVAIPKKSQRVPIAFVTPNGTTYQGGLRDNEGKGWPYICPNLMTAIGSKITLAEILRANSVPLSQKQPIRFNVSGNTWTMI